MLSPKQLDGQYDRIVKEADWVKFLQDDGIISNPTPLKEVVTIPNPHRLLKILRSMVKSGVSPFTVEGSQAALLLLHSRDPIPGNGTIEELNFVRDDPQFDGTPQASRAFKRGVKWALSRVPISLELKLLKNRLRSLLWNKPSEMSEEEESTLLADTKKYTRNLAETIRRAGGNETGSDLREVVAAITELLQCNDDLKRSVDILRLEKVSMANAMNTELSQEDVVRVTGTSTRLYAEALARERTKAPTPSKAADISRSDQVFFKTLL